MVQSGISGEIGRKGACIRICKSNSINVWGRRLSPKRTQLSFMITEKMDVTRVRVPGTEGENGWYSKIRGIWIKEGCSVLERTIIESGLFD